MIKTARLQLWECQKVHFEVLIRGDDCFQQEFGLEVSPDFVEEDHREVLAYSLKRVQEEPQARRWLSYLFIHIADQTVIGMGGYKGPPDELGRIEIGYGIAPAYRNQGFATEAARALLLDAFTDPDVQTIFAHTLPESNASNHILRKIGMHQSAVLNDPEEGEIWQYRIDRLE
ncbi:MAG: GNAT family N-acetyltransferase [Bacteroidota bacterium]